ncbi:SDR family oxidoreductase [Microbacterium gorillae]|uniref:SDR family oxidoreductase n=1 Tax=Microbacterium gorillae TaxID=1231063 RepID=UPI00058BAE23|nr:SDR family oxidoreductase [Microbacterium gorillae]
MEQSTASEAADRASTRRVVVIGGTGRVGEGIVREWLAAGAEVIVPTRSAAREAEFRDLLSDVTGLDRLHTVVTDYADFASAAATAARITTDFGDVTDVVASVGGWWQGAPLWDTDPEVWQRYFVDLTTTHIANVRAWLPRLPESGSYQLILGGSANTVVPGAGVINMEQAALLMMSRTLSAEAGAQRRLFTLILGPVATRGRPWVDPTWVSGSDVGRVTVGHALSDAPSGEVSVRSHQDADDRLAQIGGTR